MGASLNDCIEACRHSNVVEIEAELDFTILDNIAKIRRRQVFNDELKLLGFTKDGIEDMNP